MHRQSPDARTESWDMMRFYPHVRSRRAHSPAGNKRQYQLTTHGNRRTLTRCRSRATPAFAIDSNNSAGRVARLADLLNARMLGGCGSSAEPRPAPCGRIQHRRSEVTVVRWYPPQQKPAHVRNGRAVKFQRPPGVRRNAGDGIEAVGHRSRGGRQSLSCQLKR